MAKPRSTPSRAPSSASGRRSAGASDSSSRSKPDSSSRRSESGSFAPRGAGGRAPTEAKPERASKRGSVRTKAKQTPFSVNEREQKEGMRLQKFLASAGVASRRKAEELISSGAVKVNGQVVKELGTRVFPGKDRVTVRGEPVAAEDKVYFVLNKPDQMVCSAAGSVDERGRPTVLSLMHGIPQRLYPVGRLDYHSRGVLILTNDGELAAALTHPRHGVVKTYHVKFQGKLSSDEEDLLRDGVQLDDGAVTRPLAEIFGFRETDANAWYQIGLTEGLNRQIRRMGDAINHPVLKLIRVAIGDITADGLADGEYRPLSPTEVGQLLASVNLEPIKRPTAEPERSPNQRELPARDDGERTGERMSMGAKRPRTAGVRAGDKPSPRPGSNAGSRSAGARSGSARPAGRPSAAGAKKSSRAAGGRAAGGSSRGSAGASKPRSRK